jgi:hypothetical protein
VSVDFTSSLNFVVDGTILVQVPVASIIVVGNWKKMEKKLVSGRFWFLYVNII